MRSTFMLLIVAGTLATLLAAACDEDVQSDGGGTFNAAGRPAKYEADSSVTNVPFDSAAPPSPTCADYCDTYSSVCGFGTQPIGNDVAGDAGTVSDAALPTDAAVTLGTNGYLDRATCLAVCAAIPIGDWVLNGTAFGGGGAHSLVCRIAALNTPLTVADAAASSESAKRDRCAIAGPMGVTSLAEGQGTNACGGTCENYCALATALCGAGSDAGGTAQWFEGTDYASCLTDCTNHGPVMPKTYVGGIAADDHDNTLNCRIYELQRAATNTAACVNVGFVSSATTSCQRIAR